MILEDKIYNNKKVPISGLFCFRVLPVASLSLMLLLGACNAPEKKESDESLLTTMQGRAQGTTYSIAYVDTANRDLSSEVKALLLDIDQSLSTYVDSSLISKFNHKDSIAQVSQMMTEVFLLASQVHAQTEGSFDPTVKPLVNYWGFDEEKKKLSGPADSLVVDSLLQYVGLDKLVLEQEAGGEGTLPQVIFYKSQPGVQLDFNGIAQGYSVDLIADLFRERGIHTFMIELGGEVLTSGKKPDGFLWRIGVDKPVEEAEARSLQVILALDNKAVATSGSYRKFYKREGVKYSHTIDPRSGFPVDHTLLSVTVVTDNCGKADAYATAFMVMGLEKTTAFLAAHPELNIEAYLIYDDGNGALGTAMTPGIKSMVQEVD